MTCTGLECTPSEHFGASSQVHLGLYQPGLHRMRGINMPLSSPGEGGAASNYNYHVVPMTECSECQSSSHHTLHLRDLSNDIFVMCTFLFLIL